MTEENDPAGEALAVVHMAIKARPELQDGVFLGMLSPVGRFVIYVSDEEAAHEDVTGTPKMKTVEEAVEWILLEDRNDAYLIVEMTNALANWRRLAPDIAVANADHGPTRELFELGSHLFAAVVALSQQTPGEDG